MSDKIRIRAVTRDYEVIFINSFSDTLSNKDNAKSFFVIDHKLVKIFKKKSWRCFT